MKTVHSALEMPYKQVIREIALKLSPFDEIESAHQADVLQWVDSSEQLCRIKKPITPPKHLVSYCLVIDMKEQKLLLGDHIKAGLWLPPGGHVEPGEHPLVASRRELKEELSADLPLIQLVPLFLTVAKTVGNIPQHTDVSLWYIFRGDSNTSYELCSTEFNAVNWFRFEDIPSDRTDPHMARFCQKYLQTQRFLRSC